MTCTPSRDRGSTGSRPLRDAVRWECLCLASVCGALTMPPVGAAEQDARLEEVVVTGSRIVRRDFSAPSPVVTLDADAFRLSGTTNVEDLLNTLPQVVPDESRTSNATSSSAAKINLRGLGSNRTLVMLNGRRFSASEISGAVDVNNLPATLIDRVEVVTGGASAVYGSDAVVGVVNFIVDNDFEGVEVSAQYELTEERDGRGRDVSVTAGTAFADGRGHVTAFVNVTDRDTLLAGARPFTAVTIADDTATGTLSEAGSSAIPEGAILFPAAVIDGVRVGRLLFNPDGTVRPARFPEDLYNYAPATYLQVPLRRYVGSVFLNVDLTADTRATVELLRGRNELEAQFAPSPISWFGTTTIDSPFLPPETQQIFRDNYDDDGDGLASFFFRRRMVESGPRRGEDRHDVLRVLAGLDGRMRERWRWQAYYSHTDVDSESLFLNGISFARFDQALRIDPQTGGCVDPTGGCVPINVFGAGNVSDEAAAFIRFGALRDTEKIVEQVASFTVTGELWSLPDGPLDVAAGLEWRRLEAAFEPDPAAQEGDIVGSTGAKPAIGASEVAEAFVEVRVPLAEDRRFARELVVEAGARASDYARAGRVSTWKLGGEWVPLEGLRLRAMYQEAIRAPNILETFEQTSESFLDRFHADTDLCSASRDPIARGHADICIAQGLDPSLLGVFEAPNPNIVKFFFGGNPDLQPERSRSVTAGVVIEPPSRRGWSVSIDYFDIEIADAILDIQAGALASCFAINDPGSDLCRAYRRDASGRIAEADHVPRNVARQRSEGVDVAFHYSLPLGEKTANLHLTTHATWYLTNGSQTSPVTPFFDCAGYFGFTCAFSSFGVLPEVKATTWLGYEAGSLTASLRWRWLGGLDNSQRFFNQLFELPEPVLAIPRVGSKSYFDLNVGYDISPRVRIHAGIINLFDTDAALLAGAAPGINTDPATYDAIGRRYFLSGQIRY